MIGSPSLRRAAIDTLATAHFPAYADDLATYGRTLQQRNSLLRAIREETATRDQLRFWDDTFLDTGGRVVEARLRLLGLLAAPARRRPRRDRAGGGGRRRADPALRDQRPDAGRRDAARRPRPAADRYRRQGGLERLDGHRAASRRPRVRSRRPRSRRVRLARAAADRDPRLQARRAGPPDRARRPAAPAAAGRRLQRARSAPAGAPRAPHRRAAPGVRDDDDARRSRPGPARGRTGVGGPRRRRGRPADVDPAGAAAGARPRAGPVG